MRDELELKLVEKYPKIFRDYHGDMMQTCMTWGFECGNGWYNIIDELCEKLTEIEDVVAVQVKEKFGGLRFYIGGTSKENHDKIYDLISEAEEKSYKTCENCGKPGKLIKGGWLYTSCDSCLKK